MTDFSYQLYSSRNFGPLPATLKMLGELGYAQVEGYGGLYIDLQAIDKLNKDLSNNGLVMKTGHFGLEMLRDNPTRVLEITKTLGMEAVFVPAVGPAERTKDAAGWAEFGRVLAEVGKPYRGAGLTFGWHNHDFEFADLGGADKPLDLILQGSDDLALELDVAWVQVGGEDPIEWIEKYADRIVASHIKDIAPKGEALDEDGWADVGHGVMNWSAIMGALNQTGARYFVMEHDNPKDDRRFATRSIDAARKF